MKLQVDISIECESWAQLADLEQLVEEVLQTTALESGKKLLEDAEVSLLFCDDFRIRELHRDWRKLDKSTNVLSFPASNPERLANAPVLGDIAIAFETVLRESKDENKSLSDHTFHMVTHGILHLLGYDHETDKDAEEMENLERRILARHGVDDPYGSSEPVNGKKMS